LITTVKNIWVILVGVGVIAVGVMVFVFLVKFVVKTKTIDRSEMREITEQDHPLLFDFIRRVARETRAPLPKRVYLSNDVNAFVFYDSSFWSMFFPIRKNLNIGLGLVNAVDLAEFKAILAHEFGHFSQNSMKLGSYVYNVNHIIHDMLYDNDDYNTALQRFGNIGNVFSFFAQITQVIVNIIQEILQQQYARINKQYMALSRQMEFDADAIAASVTGSQPLASALYRLDFAQASFRDVLAKYGQWVMSSRKGRNVFKDHRVSMQILAEQHALRVEHGLPQIDANTIKLHRQHRVNIEDQWASHPGNEEREDHLRSLNIPSITSHESPWVLFTEPEKVQHAFTDELYANVKFERSPDVSTSEDFRAMLVADRDAYAFPPAYKGFYDNRTITPFDPAQVASATSKYETLSDALSEENLGLRRHVAVLTADIDIIERFTHEERRSKEATFDLDGKKYSVREGTEVLKNLKAELNQTEARLTEVERDLFRLYYNSCARKGNEANALANYSKMFAVHAETDTTVKQLNSMFADVNKLYQPNVTESVARFVTNNMEKDGGAIKQQIKSMLGDAAYDSFYTAAERKTLQDFVDDHRKYFNSAGLNSEAIQLYSAALQVYGNVMINRGFSVTRNVLTDQLDEINAALMVA
ncbi:MAG TPA: M48 family metallopeptidase, partial [Sphingobacteriaceae bacterium]